MSGGNPVLFEIFSRKPAGDREGARGAPLLAMTAGAFAEDIRAAGEAGMDGHLAKPLDSAAVKREILRRLR